MGAKVQWKWTNQYSHLVQETFQSSLHFSQYTDGEKKNTSLAEIHRHQKKKKHYSPRKKILFSM